MANSICRWQCPEDWAEWSRWLAAGLHARNRWRLPVLLVGVLFAHGRRTVTTWLRAAGVSDDFQDYFYFLAALGRKTEFVATQLLGAYQLLHELAGGKKVNRRIWGFFGKLGVVACCRERILMETERRHGWPGSG